MPQSVRDDLDGCFDDEGGLILPNFSHAGHRHGGLSHRAVESDKIGTTGTSVSTMVHDAQRCATEEGGSFETDRV